jgi:hypothetical protein
VRLQCIASHGKDGAFHYKGSTPAEHQRPRDAAPPSAACFSILPTRSRDAALATHTSSHPAPSESREAARAARRRRPLDSSSSPIPRVRPPPPSIDRLVGTCSCPDPSLVASYCLHAPGKSASAFRLFVQHFEAQQAAYSPHLARACSIASTSSSCWIYPSNWCWLLPGCTYVYVLFRVLLPAGSSG